MIILRTGVDFDNSTRCLVLDGQTGDLALYHVKVDGFLHPEDIVNFVIIKKTERDVAQR